ncbi:uncharacterized protein VTP21DRAFT_9448 [Calcarisporiella thermophila]|uniref:uncharacterized protein n=1 Tax=Calcarisporiella thermophila TaxID=911321 RepID=UPI0037433738
MSGHSEPRHSIASSSGNVDSDVESMGQEGFPLEAVERQPTPFPAFFSPTHQINRSQTLHFQNEHHPHSPVNNSPIRPYIRARYSYSAPEISHHRPPDTHSEHDEEEDPGNWANRLGSDISHILRDVSHRVVRLNRNEGYSSGDASSISSKRSRLSYDGHSEKSGDGTVTPKASSRDSLSIPDNKLAAAKQASITWSVPRSPILESHSASLDREKSSPLPVTRFQDELPTPLNHPVSQSQDLSDSNINSSGLVLQGKSLFLFGPKNGFRVALARFLKYRWTETFIFLMILLNWVILSISPIYDPLERAEFGKKWSDYVQFAIYIIYTIEAVCRIIVYGFLFNPTVSTIAPSGSHTSLVSQQSGASGGKPTPGVNRVEQPGNEQTSNKIAHTAYLRSGANVLDFIVVLCYWIDFIMVMTSLPRIALFRGLSALRPLKLLALTQGMSTILNSIKISVPLLLNVMIFIAFFLLLFALIGLLLFQGALTRRCVLIENGDINITNIAMPEHICGGYWNNTSLFGVYGNNGPEPFDVTRMGSYICPQGQVCISIPNHNPKKDTLSYANVFYSFVTAFVVSSMELWTDVMYMVMDGDSLLDPIYFVLEVFILAMVMIQLFIAVITTAFSKIRAESKHGAFTTDTRSAPILMDFENGDWSLSDPMYSKLHPWRQKISLFINGSAYAYIAGVIIGLDMAVMAINHAGASPTLLKALDNAETAFTAYFALEIVVRLMVYPSLRHFWQINRNKADLILAIATIIIQVPTIHNWSGYRFLTAFQILRAYRLLVCFPKVNQLTQIVVGNASGIINLILFTFVFMFVVTPVPMQLFGGLIEPMENGEPKIPFQTFDQSFVALFIIFSGENWVDFLYDAMEAQSGFQRGYTAIFFILYYFVAHHIVLSLFVAIVLENLDLEDDEKLSQQVEQYFNKKKIQQEDEGYSKRKYWYIGFLKFLPRNQRLLRVKSLPQDMVPDLSKGHFYKFMVGEKDETEEKRKGGLEFLFTWFNKLFKRTKSEITTVSLNGKDDEEEVRQGSQHSPRHRFSQWWRHSQVDGKLNDKMLKKQDTFRSNHDTEQEQKQSLRHILEDELRELFPNYNNSWGILPPNHPFRKFCQRIVGSSTDKSVEKRSIFNWFIMACVLASVVLVVVNDPATRMRASDRDKDVLKYTELSLQLIFTLEIFIRVTADGLLFTPSSYLSNGWNRLDFVVVLLGYVGMFLESTSTNFDRVLSASKAMRILRLIRYFPRVRAMFYDIFLALPRIIDATLLSIFMIVPFALYGVNLFAGKFASCNDPGINFEVDCTGEFFANTQQYGVLNASGAAEILIPRVWSNPISYNFDNFPSAMLALFEMAALEGWVDVMITGMQIPENIGEQPNFSWDDSKRFYFIFFIAFVFLGGIAVVQIFIGIILETFKQRSGISLLTLEQAQWRDLQRQLKLIRASSVPVRPSSPWRARCFDMITDKKGYFQHFMTGVIVLNILIMATEYEGQPEILQRVRACFYLVFILLYAFEILVKMLGLGWRKWRENGWNLYDLIVVTGALVSVFPRFWVHIQWVNRIESVFMVAIAFRLAQKFRALKTLFKAFADAMPAIANVTAVFLLVLVIYAIMFMEVFGLTRFNEWYNPHANFRSFSDSLLLLVRIVTGENWNKVMHDCMVEPPYCVYDPKEPLNSDCGHAIWAYILFISFYVICTYIFLNMFIAVIIHSFSYIYEEDDLSLITMDDLNEFKRCWAHFDPLGTGYIPPEDFVKLIKRIKGKFGMRIYDDQYTIPNLLKASLDAEYKRRPSVSASYQDEASVDRTLNVANSNDPPDNKRDYSSKVNLQNLNGILQGMDMNTVRERKNLFNRIYKEIMLSARIRGLAFNSVLSVLSYMLVDTNRALSLEEMVRRRDFIQDLEKSVNEERLNGFLRTLVQRRRYLKIKQEMNRNQQVPTILVRSPSNNRNRNTESPSLQKSANQQTTLPVSQQLSRQHTSSSSPNSAPHEEQKYSSSLPTSDLIQGIESEDISATQAKAVMGLVAKNVWATLLDEFSKEEELRLEADMKTGLPRGELEPPL